LTTALPAALKEITSCGSEAWEGFCASTGRAEEFQLEQPEREDDKLIGFITDFIDSFWPVSRLA
jgi:hypothetical protein